MRSFFDVLWEWTYSTVLTVKVRDIFMVSLSQTIEHEEEMEDMKETNRSTTLNWHMLLVQAMVQ